MRLEKDNVQQFVVDRKKPSRSGGVLWGTALAAALAAPALLVGVAPAPAVGQAAGVDSAADVETVLSQIVEVPYTTTVVEDDSLPAGVEVEKSAGQTGLEYRYTTTYSDVAGPSVSSEVVSEAVPRVVHRGTKVDMPTATEPPAPEPEPAPAPSSGATRDQSAPAAASRSDVVTTGQYGLRDLQFMGVIMWGGYKFTYYSQQVLPGGGLRIPGRHVNAGGFVSDGDGYIVLAGSAPMGTVYPTPFGYPGKIYDRGTYGNHLDVYTQ